MLRSALSPAGQARALVLVATVLVAAGGPLLDPSRTEAHRLLVLLAVMAVLITGSLVLPWHRWSPWALLAFPSCTMVGNAVLGQIDDRFGVAFVALHMLCFVWAGLYGPRGAALALLPVAVPTWVLTVDDWNPTAAIQLLIDAVLWLVVAQLLAGLTRRQAAALAQLHRAAHTDSLTTLDNRSSLQARLESLGPDDVVVMVDLDHFKAVNDDFGHAAGDRVLREFGETVRACLRGSDYAARYGGEEFVVVLRNAVAADAHEVTARIRHRWRRSGGGITFSAGIAAHSAARDVQSTLALADRALYAAKRAGRDRDRVAADDDHAQATTGPTGTPAD